MQIYFSFADTVSRINPMMILANDGKTQSLSKTNSVPTFADPLKAIQGVSSSQVCLSTFSTPSVPNLHRSLNRKGHPPSSLLTGQTRKMLELKIQGCQCSPFSLEGHWFPKQKPYDSWRYQHRMMKQDADDKPECSRIYLFSKITDTLGMTLLGWHSCNKLL